MCKKVSLFIVFVFFGQAKFEFSVPVTFGRIDENIMFFISFCCLIQGFHWGTKFGKSPISDLCTEIVLFWWDFSLQGQHWDYGLALSLGISQKALMV